MAKDKGKKFVGPKGICLCGHTGDGEDSEHGQIGIVYPGTGACHMKGCNCKYFRWKEWTRKYQNFLALMK